MHHEDGSNIYYVSPFSEKLSFNTKLKRFWKFARTTFSSIKCGFHSNIPKCCVFYFITIWALKELLPQKLAHRIWYWHFVSVDSQYISCPICILRNRVPNNISKCECYKRNIKLENSNGK